MKRLLILAAMPALAVFLIGASSSEVSTPPSPAAEKVAVTASAVPSYQLNWWSVNNGGDIRVESANYGLGVTIGQAAAGHSASTNYRMGVGFWYGMASPSGCPITLAGDLNINGAINSADIIYLVNYVFKSGAAPLPCEANGDVTCDGNVAASDIIHLVNFVFKSGPDPCNTCTSPLAGAC